MKTSTSPLLFLSLPLLLSSLGCGDKEDDDTGTPSAEDDTGEVLCGSTQGFVYGTVRSAETGGALAGVEVSADSEGGENIQASASASGGYELDLEGGQSWDIYAQADDGSASGVTTLDIEACKEYELDLLVEEKVTADKPNLYLYPAADTPTRVALELGQGAWLAAVEPALPWRGVAHPDGTFTDSADGTRWGYLFYEVGLPRWQVQRTQREAGWCLPGEGILDALAEILWAHGFNAREVDDFVEAWRHDLPAAPRYGVYPQPWIAEQTGVWIQPDLPLSRLWLLVEPGDRCAPLYAPEILPLDRQGPHAVEWGVILQGFVL